MKRRSIPNSEDCTDDAVQDKWGMEVRMRIRRPIQFWRC